VLRRFGAAALVLLALPLRAHGADVTDRLSKAIALPDGTPVFVEATVATVTITGSARPDVAVTIVRHAPDTASLERLPALVETRPDGLHISVVQADDGKDAALRADVTIDAPAAAVFQAIRVFEGRVTITGLTAACDARLDRGPIDASGLAGRIRLEAGIGSVDLRQSTLSPQGMMRIRVFNGLARVRFDRAPAIGRVLAVTFNGTLTSDIPLTLKDKFGPRFGETTLGGDPVTDPVLSIDVVKGDIAIKVGG
jgi:hypothetical protein